jgi:hypothetical protein
LKMNTDEPIEGRIHMVLNAQILGAVYIYYKIVFSLFFDAPWNIYNLLNFLKYINFLPNWYSCCFISKSNLIFSSASIQMFQFVQGQGALMFRVNAKILTK